MPTFIKSGFWNIKRNELPGELNLNRLIQSLFPITNSKLYKATFLGAGGQFTGQVSIIKNTFQEITWSKVSVGYYTGTFTTPIDPTLLSVSMKQVQKEDDGDGVRDYIDFTYDEEKIIIFCFTPSGTLRNLHPYTLSTDYPDFVVTVEYFGE